MKKIGLTGGIGSGKSTIGKVFSAFGIPVFDADTASKTIVEENEIVKAQIKDLLGDEAFLNGTYNRPFVASRVFKEKHLLEKLNAIIHPATIRAFRDWVEQQTTPYVIKEAAILFESGSYKELDDSITVQAPEELRIARVLSRDKVTEAQVRSRILAQFTDEQRANVAGHVIINDDQEAVLPQVLKLHNFFLGS